MKIIYLHGFNSSKESETYSRLKRMYPEQVISFTYDFISPVKSYNQIGQIIEETWETDKNLILVGSSLGGFWANYFAQKLHLKCLLINPAYNPSESAKKYIGTVKSYTSNETWTLTANDVEEYKQFESLLDLRTFRIVIIGTKDTVINPQKSAEYFKGTRIIFANEMEHRMAETDEPLIKNCLDEIINTEIL